MVLAPDVRGEQVVERRDRPPPRDLARDLQPLRVLVEHRVDDVDERLVAVEEPVPAGEQVALEPALAEVLAEHLHHPAVGREVVVSGRTSPCQARSVTSNTAPRRLDAVSSGPNSAERVRVALDHVAQEGAEHARRLARRAWPARHLDRVVAEVGQPQVRRSSAAVGVRARAHPALALGRRRQHVVARRRRRSSNSSSGRYDRIHASSSASGVRGLARLGERHLVGARRALARARSSPSACAARASASAAVRVVAAVAGAPLDRARSSSSASSSAAAIGWCIVAGSSPSTKIGRCP